MVGWLAHCTWLFTLIIDPQLSHSNSAVKLDSKALSFIIFTFMAYCPFPCPRPPPFVNTILSHAMHFHTLSTPLPFFRISTKFHLIRKFVSLETVRAQFLRCMPAVESRFRWWVWDGFWGLIKAVLSQPRFSKYLYRISNLIPCYSIFIHIRVATHQIFQYMPQTKPSLIVVCRCRIRIFSKRRLDLGFYIESRPRWWFSRLYLGTFFISISVLSSIDLSIKSHPTLDIHFHPFPFPSPISSSTSDKTRLFGTVAVCKRWTPIFFTAGPDLMVFMESQLRWWFEILWT